MALASLATTSASVSSRSTVTVNGEPLTWAAPLVPKTSSVQRSFSCTALAVKLMRASVQATVPVVVLAPAVPSACVASIRTSLCGWSPATATANVKPPASVRVTVAPLPPAPKISARSAPATPVGVAAKGVPLTASPAR